MKTLTLKLLEYRYRYRHAPVINDCITTDKTDCSRGCLKTRRKVKPVGRLNN